MKHSLYFLLLVLAGLASCGKPNQTPKPKGYFRIDFPAKSYHVYESPCGYSFEVPDYAEVIPEPDSGKQRCWVNIEYKPFNATLHMSYRDLKNSKLENLEQDAMELVYKHTIRAENILEYQLAVPGSRGMLFELTGNTATPLSFYTTDSVRHFLRGSLYFNERTNNDSTAPVLNFLKADINHMLKTVEWKAR